MKKALLLLPASLASMVLAQATPLHPSVYVLMTSTRALAAVSSALDTLGYSYAETTTAWGGKLGLDPHTYAVLDPGTVSYQKIWRENPSARFILPVTKAGDGSSSWLGAFFQEAQVVAGDVQPDPADAIRAFFGEMEETRQSASQQLLELDVFPHSSYDQAQTWVTLCDFLGLGYSAVERLRLWRFPK